MSEKPTGSDSYDDYYDDNNEVYEYEYAPEEDYEDESDIDYDLQAVIGTYDGQRNSKDERHGFGKAVLPNGDVYTGNYKNGLRHGNGQYVFKNGARYQGCYKNGLRNGQGVMYYPDGTKYQGQWSENKKTGKGVYKYGNGDQFSGSWKADTKHGLGTYTFCKTGAILKGAWSEGKAIQNFEMFFPTDGTGSGFTFHGTWSDDNETISGEGYFVFENLKCMLKGVHVETPFYKNSNHKSRWAPDEIVPFERGALPRVLDRWPTLRDLSSCDSGNPATDPPLSAAASSGHMEEAYEHRDDLWGEAEELEMELDVHDYVEVDRAVDVPSSEIVQDGLTGTPIPTVL